MSEQKWPDALWIVRHGQSAGNVARDEAEAIGAAVINLATRDMDVPLSELGERQAIALGQWFGEMPRDERPNALLVSPYVRAQQTAVIALQSAGMNLNEMTHVVDERLREKEFGILDRLTKFGIQERYPEQAEMRSALGKFYHRPPGGESWCDVILRLRSVIDTLTREYSKERVLIVCHSVIVSCFRYLFERMSEAEILAIDKQEDIANCSVTCYEFDPHVGRHGKLVLRYFNHTAPLEHANTPVTTKRDVPVAPK